MNSENPGPTCSRVLDGSLNLRGGEIPFNVKHLSRVNEICVFDLVAVSLKKKRPLVRIAINQSVGGNTPEVLAGMNNP